MLKNIKASFFLKVLFSHTSEIKKLKVVRYNKYLQKILDRRLIHYKILSKRYIVLCQEGKWKEYDLNTDKLIFEGEYLNGERNGKGKEYDDYGKLVFEGEYLNGKRNGKGKEYNVEGKLKFEGEYYNGRRWNGKGYDIEGN